MLFFYENYLYIWQSAIIKYLNEHEKNLLQYPKRGI